MTKKGKKKENFTLIKKDTITDLRGLQLLPLEIADDGTLHIIDELSHQGQVQFDVTVIKLIGTSSIL
jgi:hypothetical protein